MTVGTHNESRDTSISGVSLPAVILEKEERCPRKEESYQFFGVQVQSVTLLSAFRLMSKVWSLS